jgi:hypothetical protein
VPLQYHPSPAGVYEHGDRLRELWRAYPDDFGPPERFEYTPPAPEDFGEDGGYCAIRRDEWGVEWEHRIFGVWGHPIARPLDDLANLDGYQPPALPPLEPDEIARQRAERAEHRRRYFLLASGGILFETLHSVRRFEDVLTDLAMDTPEIHRIADLIVSRMEAEVTRNLELGADAVQFGDDYGTTEGLMLSRELWNRFFAPRYRRLMDPVRRAGIPVFFHICGRVIDLLEDLRNVGVSAVWPQLSCHDNHELAARCRDLELAVQLHFRGDLLVRRSPEEIRRRVHETAETFRVHEGGAWYYVEVDNGFPFENVRALFEAVEECR